jgi:hypothetical protein
MRAVRPLRRSAYRRLVAVLALSVLAEGLWTLAALAGPVGAVAGLTPVFLVAGLAPGALGILALVLGRLGPDEVAHPLDAVPTEVPRAA